MSVRIRHAQTSIHGARQDAAAIALIEALEAQNTQRRTWLGADAIYTIIKPLIPRDTGNLVFVADSPNCCGSSIVGWLWVRNDGTTLDIRRIVVHPDWRFPKTNERVGKRLIQYAQDRLGACRELVAMVGIDDGPMCRLLEACGFTDDGSPMLDLNDGNRKTLWSWRPASVPVAIAKRLTVMNPEQRAEWYELLRTRVGIG